MKILRIQDKNGIYQTADLMEDSFVMNFHVTDIGELDKRKKNISLTIKLPITDKNCHILDFMHLPDVVTNIRNKQVNCYLEENGAVLAGKGSVMKFISVEDNNINCQINSGLITFADKLEEKSLSSVDLGEIEWNNNGLAGNDHQLNNVFYGLAEFAKDKARLTVQSDNIFNTKYALPFIKINHVIEKITEELGYTLNYVKHRRRQEIEVLRIGNYQKADNSFNPLMGTGTASGTLELSTGASNRMAWIELNNDTLFNKGKNEYFEYTAKNDITFQGQIKVNMESDKQFYVNAYINGVGVHSEPSSLNNESGNNEIRDIIFDFGIGRFVGDKNPYPGDVVLAEGETFKVQLQAVFTGIGSAEIYFDTRTTVLDVWMTDTNDMSVPYGGIIPISSNLGFKDCLEFYKFYMKLYGYLMYVDERRKVVYLKTYKDVWDYKSQNIDWTEKLSEEDTGYSFVNRNYGQNNIIDLQADSNDYKQQAEFTVADQTLSKEKTLFTLETKSCPSVVRYRDTVANIDDITVTIPKEDSNKDITYSIDTTKPVCCTMFEGQDIAMNYRFDLTDQVEDRVSLAIIEPLKLQDIIDLQYDVLINNMLNNAIILNTKMHITPQDIERYNSTINGVPQCFVPVYLKQVGKFFYINSIKNFATNRLSDVELVRISGALGEKSTYLQISRNDEIIYSSINSRNPIVVVGPDAQTLTFNIESTVSWMVYQNNSTAPISPTSGPTGETQVTVSLPAVTQDTDYTYTIKYGGIELVLTIRQILGYRVTVSSTPNGTATANGSSGTVIIPIGSTVTLSTTNNSNNFFGYWIVNGVYFFNQSFKIPVTEDLNAVAYWFDSSKYHKLYCSDENTSCLKDNTQLPWINSEYWIVETSAEYSFTNYQAGTLSGYIFNSENYYRNPFTSFSKQITAEDTLLKVYYDNLLVNVTVNNENVIEEDTDDFIKLLDPDNTIQSSPVWIIPAESTDNFRFNDAGEDTVKNTSIFYPPAKKGEWKVYTTSNRYVVSGDSPFNYTGNNLIPNIVIDIYEDDIAWQTGYYNIHNDSATITNRLIIPSNFEGSWQISANYPDVTVSPASGTSVGNFPVDFNIAPNLTGSDRTITILATFTRNDGLAVSTASFTINQPAFVIQWLENEITVDSLGETVKNSLIIPSGSVFQVTADTIGVSYVPSFGIGSQEITFDVPLNDTGSERTIQVSALVNGQIYTFRIIQQSVVFTDVVRVDPNNITQIEGVELKYSGSYYYWTLAVGKEYRVLNTLTNCAGHNPISRDTPLERYIPNNSTFVPNAQSHQLVTYYDTVLFNCTFINNTPDDIYIQSSDDVIRIIRRTNIVVEPTGNYNIAANQTSYLGYQMNASPDTSYYYSLQLAPANLPDYNIVYTSNTPEVQPYGSVYSAVFTITNK